MRSRSPELVRQELFAFLAVCQALCALEAEAARTAGIDPGRISPNSLALQVKGTFLIHMIKPGHSPGEVTRLGCGCGETESEPGVGVLVRNHRDHMQDRRF